MVVDIAASYLNLYAMPPGRRAYLAGCIYRRATADGLTNIAERAAALEAHDRRTVELELLRRTGSRGLYSPRTTNLDGLLDRTLGGVGSYLDSQVRLYGPEHERGSAAARLQESLFPEGVVGITRLSYVQQCVAVDVMLGRLREPALAEAAAALPEMAAALERVRALNEEYRTSIDEDRPRVPPSEEVRAAQIHGQALLACLLIVILAHYLTEAPNDENGLAAMLEPIVQQSEAVRRARLRRRVPGDVNPDTGEELPDTGDDVSLPEDDGLIAEAPTDALEGAGAVAGNEPGAA